MHNDPAELDEMRKALAEAPPQQPAQLTRFMTHVLDDMVTIPGTKYRAGLDPILSLVPGVGTTVGTALGVVMMTDALRLRMPIPVLLRMGANYLVDWLIGLVPFLGAVGDVAWRANRRNLGLLNRTITDREQVRKASIRYWIAAGAIVVGGLLIMLVLTVLLVGWVWSKLSGA